MNYLKFFKYLIMLLVVSSSTYMIPNCSIANEHAIYIGLLSSTTFVLLDIYLPTILYFQNQKERNEILN